MIFGFEDLTARGKLLPGGALAITESTSLVKNVEGDMRCAKAMTYSSYEGEVAPKISFLLTVDGQEKPLYRSHSYRMGREGEYALQQWRTPPAFLPNLSLKVKIELYCGKGGGYYKVEW